MKLRLFLVLTLSALVILAYKNDDDANLYNGSSDNIRENNEDNVGRTKTYGCENATKSYDCVLRTPLDDEEIIIPVIVHNLTGKDIDDDMARQMRVLNGEYLYVDHYRPFNELNSSYPDYLLENAVNPNIRFVLDRIIPVVTNQSIVWDEKSVLKPASKMDEAKKISKPVEPFKYLNIWIANMVDQTKVFGHAYMPFQFHDQGGCLDRESYDGVIASHTTIGRTSAGASRNLLVHEIGHWLNLHHTWGGEYSCDKVFREDGVDDTDKYNYKDPSDAIYCDGGSVDGIKTKHLNHMNYIGPHCPGMFSQGQVNIMRKGFMPGSGRCDNRITQEQYYSDFPGIRQISLLDTAILKITRAIPVAANNNYMNLHYIFPNKVWDSNTFTNPVMIFNDKDQFIPNVLDKGYKVYVSRINRVLLPKQNSLGGTFIEEDSDYTIEVLGNESQDITFTQEPGYIGQIIHHIPIVLKGDKNVFRIRWYDGEESSRPTTILFDRRASQTALGFLNQGKRIYIKDFRFSRIVQGIAAPEMSMDLK